MLQRKSSISKVSYHVRVSLYKASAGNQIYFKNYFIINILITQIAYTGTRQLDNSQLVLPDIFPGQYIYDQHQHTLFIFTNMNFDLLLEMFAIINMIKYT